MSTLEYSTESYSPEQQTRDDASQRRESELVYYEFIRCFPPVIPNYTRFRSPITPAPSRSPELPDAQEAEAFQELGRLMIQQYRRSSETPVTPAPPGTPVTAPNAPVRNGRRNIEISPSPINFLSTALNHIPTLDHQKIQDTETEIVELQCSVCMTNQKVIANRCGHQLCCGCSYEVTCRDSRCPECRHPWKDLLRLF
jgi:hypothetical protein